MADKENINFVRKFTNAAAITDGTRWYLDLAAVKRDFGYNYNFILILDNHTASGVVVEFDGDTNNAIPSPPNGGMIGFAREDNFKFTDVAVFNNSGAEAAIGSIVISIGRMGREK